MAKTKSLVKSFPKDKKNEGFRFPRRASSSDRSTRVLPADDDDDGKVLVPDGKGGRVMRKYADV